MPFTPSHVAAVLPFVRTPLFPAALVIGSMAPDLFYYVPIRVPRDFAHSPLGIVTADLLFGIVVFVLWQLVFRRPAVDFAPRWLRTRMAAVPWSGLRPAGMPWWRFAVILVASVLLGATTHVVWDAFTHEGWLVSRLAWLQHPLGPLPVYQWGQHASTILGAVILVLWAVAWARSTRPLADQGVIGNRLRSWGWLSVAAAGLAVALTIWLRGIAAGDRPFDSSLVFVTVTIGLAGAGLVAMLFCLAWWMLPATRSRRRADRAAKPSAGP